MIFNNRISVCFVIFLSSIRYGEVVTDTSEGRDIYIKQCAICHQSPRVGYQALKRRLGEGEADLSQRDHLDGEFVSIVVRNGIGLMPPFTRALVSDRELKKIQSYLTRNNVEEKDE